MDAQSNDFFLQSAWVSVFVLNKAVKNLPLALISLGSPIGSSYSHEVVAYVLCSSRSGVSTQLHKALISVFMKNKQG